MLRVPCDEIIGRRLDDFADPEFQPPIVESWTQFLNGGEQAGTLRLSGPSGMLWHVEYTATGNVLPVRHVVALRERTTPRDAADNQQPRVEEYALYLLDVRGCVAAWYSGAHRVYAYAPDEGDRS